jgi:uncharacterized protein with von Willebrand factor type A (vWA) domain
VRGVTNHTLERGALPGNLLEFGRVLRRAGLPIGTGQVLDAVRAAEIVGLARRDDLFHALASVFVSEREQRDVFAQAFDLFFREPVRQDQALSMLLEGARRAEGPPPILRRVREAWSPPIPIESRRERPEETEDEVDAVLAFSSDEALRRKDFEQMSADETRRAKALIARMRFDVANLRTRRTERHHRGAIDMRRTLRKSIASGGAIALAFEKPRTRPPALVVICDISGSMERYSRMLLHFVHTLANARDRVHAFVFGTRLTNVTRLLRDRDVDAALGKLGREVLDWSGGTRIRASLREFNVRWSRRVLGQGAIVLLVTDGLDRDVEHGLDREVERLRRSSRRLVWLNPLLRYEGFQPLAAGVRVLFDRVDEHRPVHDLASLEQLLEALEAK